MNTSYELSRAVEYDIDFTELAVLAERLSCLSALRTTQHWFFCSKDQILDSLKKTINMYNAYNNREWRMKVGKFDSGRELIREAMDHVEWPRYIRDVVREICRPMHDGNDVYIPRTPAIKDQDYNYSKKDSCIYVDAFMFDRIKSAAKHTNLVFVSLLEESPKPMPFTGYYEGKVYSSSQLPNFRWEAMSMLKWLRFTPMTTSKKVEESRFFEDFFSSFTKASGILQVDEDGRFVINGTTMWTSRVITIPMTRFESDKDRFPTIEHASSTPPASREPSFKRKKKKVHPKNEAGNTDEVVDSPG